MTAITHGPGLDVGVKFHICPVCRREIAEVHGTPRSFYRHNDTAGNWCPMSGQPIPPRDGAE